MGKKGLKTSEELLSDSQKINSIEYLTEKDSAVEPQQQDSLCLLLRKYGYSQ